MPILILFAFILVILLNVLAVWAVIHRAIRKKIIPDLTEKGLIFESYKWLGFFNTGDFDDLTLTFVTTNGSPSISVYINVFYRSSTEQKRVTARIDTLFLFIRRVKYSSEI